MRNHSLLPLLLLVACAPAREPAGSTPPADDFEGCEPSEVLEQTCGLIEAEEVIVEGWCDFGQGTPSIFRTAQQWDEFLARCDTDVIDPVPDLDWGDFDIVGTTLWAGGCTGTNGTLWVADCGTTQHLAFYSTGCGECDAIWVTSHFMKVPADAVQELVLEQCVPAGEECVDAP